MMLNEGNGLVCWQYVLTCLWQTISLIVWYPVSFLFQFLSVYQIQLPMNIDCRIPWLLLPSQMLPKTWLKYVPFFCFTIFPHCPLNCSHPSWFPTIWAFVTIFYSSPIRRPNRHVRTPSSHVTLI